MNTPIEHDYIGIGISLSDSGSTATTTSSDLKTELRLALPGSDSPPPLSLSLTPRGSKRLLSEPDPKPAPKPKAQVVGWPPVRSSFRKNTMAHTSVKGKEDGCLYVKVSMDGAPYLRKVDLGMYTNYKELSVALATMFSCFTLGQCGSHGTPARDGKTENKLTDHGSENVLTYEDKDGDWMLVGDVPWGMFTETCRRLRIMKGSDAIGLAPRIGEKIKNRN